MFASIFLPVLILFQVPTLTVTPAQPHPTETPNPVVAEQKEELPTVTYHATHVGSRALNYSVTTGFVPLKNAVSGETEAKVFFMAYTLDNPPAGRPLMFSFNGGPGS